MNYDFTLDDNQTLQLCFRKLAEHHLAEMTKVMQAFRQKYHRLHRMLRGKRTEPCGRQSVMKIDPGSGHGHGLQQGNRERIGVSMRVVRSAVRMSTEGRGPDRFPNLVPVQHL